MASWGRGHAFAFDDTRTLIINLLDSTNESGDFSKMARAQDMLDEAITLISGAGQTELADRLSVQREKFFFTSLAGVPLANKVKKAGTALNTDGSAASVAAVEALVTEIEDKADAPGTVLT